MVTQLYDESTFTFHYFLDVCDYVVTRPDMDGKPAVDNYKGLAEATNLLRSGHVDPIMSATNGEKCQLKACLIKIVSNNITVVRCRCLF